MFPHPGRWAHTGPAAGVGREAGVPMARLRRAAAAAQRRRQRHQLAHRHLRRVPAGPPPPQRAGGRGAGRQVLAGRRDGRGAVGRGGGGLRRRPGPAGRGPDGRRAGHAGDAGVRAHLRLFAHPGRHHGAAPGHVLVLALCECASRCAVAAQRTACTCRSVPGRRGAADLGARWTSAKRSCSKTGRCRASWPSRTSR